LLTFRAGASGHQWDFAHGTGAVARIALKPITTFLYETAQFPFILRSHIKLPSGISNNYAGKIFFGAVANMNNPTETGPMG
jgi:hypothetical protein